MAGVLGLGIYLTHFVWTFWIFEEPTLGGARLSCCPSADFQSADLSDSLDFCLFEAEQ
jgi:hypothetical protein